jgi:hypothetical protein
MDIHVTATNTHKNIPLNNCNCHGNDGSMKRKVNC